MLAGHDQKEEKSNAPKFWGALPTVLLTAGVFLTSQVIAGAMILIIPLILGWEKPKTDNWLDSVMVNFSLIIIVEALVIAMIYKLLKLKKSTFEDIGLAWPRAKDIVYALAGFGIYFLAYVVLAFSIKLIFPEVNFDQQQQLGFDTYQQGIALILIFLALVVAAPITEEILARGFLYTGLKSQLPKWGAALITSLLFALAHLQFGNGASLVWVAAVDTFVLSLVLIYLRERTGYLGAPIILHMIKNGLAFVLLFILQI